MSTLAVMSSLKHTMKNVSIFNEKKDVVSDGSITGILDSEDDTFPEYCTIKNNSEKHHW